MFSKVLIHGSYRSGFKGNNGCVCNHPREATRIGLVKMKVSNTLLIGKQKKVSNQELDTCYRFQTCENSLKSNETKPPSVLSPRIKCEALHQDYFQTSGAVKDPSEKEYDCQNVTELPESFNSPSSTNPCYHSTHSDIPLLSYDNIPSPDHIQPSDNIPQSPDFSADKEIKSTSLSDLCRISPLTLSTFQADLTEHKDCSQNQGLSQSCHEYYNTEHISTIDESQKHHESIRSSLVGEPYHILKTSELISCPKSVTNIQQARRRCIPKVGIRTIPLIKIKPDWKLALNTKDAGKEAEKGNCKDKEINEEVTLLNDQIVAGGKQESESAKLVTTIAENSKIIGEVILHEPYSREILSPVSNDDSDQLKTETEEDLESNGQNLNTILEENKVLSEIKSEAKLTFSSQENSLGILNKEDAEAEIEEEIGTPNIQETPKLKDKLFVQKAVLLDDSETANTTDSLFVNKDEDSLNTVTDILEEEFCTQYSDTEIENQGANKIAENRDCTSESEDSDYEELPNDYIDTNAFNSQPVKLSKSAVDGIIDIEKLEGNLKPRTCLSLGRDSKLEYFSTAENFKTAELKNIQSDSDGTLYFSFNSLDNAKLNESCGTLCKGTRKLPLKWTPRVLLESRISSLTSGTFSEASFQTADTYRTFYSAQSFQLDSFDNFQTCEDLQACTEQEPKTKFSKAKEALIRGRDFVKAKFDDYRKRFPNLRRLNLGEQSACHRPCGFSCVHFGREISQYSLNDTFGIKGDHSKESKEGQSDQCERNCCECEEQDEAICDSNLIMDKDNGLKNSQLPKSGCQKRGPIGIDTSGRDDVSKKHAQRIASHGSKGTVKSDMSEREISEDDLPVGSEAISIPREKKQSENGDLEGKPSSKRLRWVSAVEKTQGTSISSSFTSNSSVEQLLCQRQMDPESMLRSLGFDGGPNSDESANRIPERFLVNPCAAKGIDIFQFVMTHPELQHMVYERTPPVPATGTGTAPPLDETDSGTDNAPQPKGSMQQHHFSSVLQGVRFIHTAQSLGNFPAHSPAHQVPDDEMKQISSIPSVLDFPNRRFLARQGFYGKEFASCSRKPQGEQTGMPADRQISAEQRRKQFQHSGRSKNWSLTEDSETDDSSATDKSDPHKDSFDQGFMLRSFSDRFSSESSVESSDSYENKRDELRRQNSISYLRKQYQDTIRNSVDTGDGELPVFDSELETFDLEFDIDNERPDRNKLKKQQSIGDIRKAQVDRLMTAEEDDGDYFAHPLRSTRKEQLLKQAQNSTQSTITGSPVTPKEFRYSFEKTLPDGDNEFTFPDTDSDSNSKVLKDQSSAVSIVIEDEGGVEEPIAFETHSNVHSNPNELTPLSLIKRTDSSNTIVQGDNLFDIEHSEGDATPRPGDVSPGLLLQPPDFIDNKLIHTDAFSESTSSTETLATVLPADSDVETTSNKPLKDTDEKQCDTAKLGNHSEVRVQISQDAVKNFLKPDLPRPQESFELEEISSADNPYEDINGNSTKTYLKLGQLEKSLSTHSDSSGFADIDQAMETPPINELSGGITPSFEMAKRRRQSLTKQRTLDGGLIPSHLEEHQYKSTQSPLMQTENRERKVCGSVHAIMQHYDQEHFEMMNKEHVHSRLHLCGKSSSLEDTENVNPALQSIRYIPSEQAQSDKSVVYSISVPMVTNIPRPEPVGQVRYVSSVKFDIDSESSADNDSVKSLKIKQAGPVLHQKIITDLDIGEGQNIKNESKDLYRTNLDSVNNEEIEINGATSRLKNISKSQITELTSEIPTSNRNDTEEQKNLQNSGVSSESVKHKILSRKRTKDALIAANSQTADWLLSNGKQVPEDGRQQDFTKTWLHGRIGRPIWASTPDLNSRLVENERNVKISQGRHIGKSLDIDIDDELNEDRFNIQMGQQSFSKHTSLDESASVYHQPSNLRNYNEQSTVIVQDVQHFAQEMRQSYLPSNIDEGVSGDGNSYIGSSTGMPEEQVQYMKLAKLVNGPSLIVGTNIKMPIIKFVPNIQMKDWTQLPKQKHLEEETRLMQHAVQRYKVELIAMETMLFNMKQLAEQHLNKDERLEVEELQHLWSEVRKEVNKMEDLLSLRLTSVLNGNVSYNPLDAVEIVHTMIELLREQLYHQQMCIERDTDIDNIDDNEAESRSFGYVSNRSTSSADPLLSDLTNQMSDIKLSMSRSQTSQKEELKQSLSELKESILSEVKQEVTSTQNVKMLQLQVQAREEEIKRLKLELLQQNIEVGKTRKRQMLESDV